jgi:hypothetical protein
MSTRVTHLNKSGFGMASMTACGRNILRTPISADWADFKADRFRCVKCEASKQAELNTRRDLENWVPEDDGAWMAADDAMIAAHRAKVAAK